MSNVVYFGDAARIRERDLHRAEILSALQSRDFTRFVPALRALGMEQPETISVSPRSHFYQTRHALLTQVMDFVFADEARARLIFPDATFTEFDFFFKGLVEDRVPSLDEDAETLDWSAQEIDTLIKHWVSLKGWAMPRHRDFDHRLIDQGSMHADVVGALFGQPGDGDWAQKILDHAEECLLAFETYVRECDDQGVSIPLMAWRDMTGMLLNVVDVLAEHSAVDDDHAASPFVRYALMCLERWPEGHCASERIQHLQSIIDGTADDSLLNGRAVASMDSVTGDYPQGPMPSTTQEFDDALHQIGQSIATGAFPKNEHTIIPT